jgi:2-methylcitrate dehydratase PrpD
MISVDRRTALAGLAAAGAVLPAGSGLAAPERSDFTGALARHMVAARTAALPAAVLEAAKHRILDTLGAIISGAKMKPGEAALRYVRSQGGTPQARVVASGYSTSAVMAALANGMCAHADETDDFEPVTKAHPGCSAVPAALAMGEKNNASGMALIRAVVLGYDLGCRLLMALGPDSVRAGHRSAEGTAATYCALGSAILAPLDETGMRHALSYGAQQVSGLWSWVDDEDHIEKAFDFAGMGARNGVMAVTMVEAGLTGVHDVLDGTHSLLKAMSAKPAPEELVKGLGQDFFITKSAIKTYTVGYPNQSALDALLTLRRENRLTADMVKSVLVRLPTDAIGIVGTSAMPDVNNPHLVAVALLKGAVSFDDAHDVALMKNPAVLAIRARVKTVADDSLMDPVAPRGAIVELALNDGRVLTHHTRFPSGTPENPLSAAQVTAKVMDLIVPVLGKPASQRLVDAVWQLEKMGSVRQLAALMAAPAGKH